MAGIYQWPCIILPVLFYLNLPIISTCIPIIMEITPAPQHAAQHGRAITVLYRHQYQYIYGYQYYVRAHGYTVV